MSRIIRKVAILGAGVMGTRIACHFANAGYEVILLGRINRNLTDEDRKKGLLESSAEVMNRNVNLSLYNTVTSAPAPLYRKEFATRMTTGNTESDLPLIAECDWIIESVTEDLSVKKDLLSTVDSLRKPGTLITSNTSGISINSLCEGRSEGFRKNFCGTHVPPLIAAI